MRHSESPTLAEAYDLDAISDRCALDEPASGTRPVIWTRTATTAASEERCQSRKLPVSCLPKVCFGSIATETGLSDDVRSTPVSDRTTDIPDRELRAMNEYCHVTRSPCQRTARRMVGSSVDFDRAIAPIECARSWLRSTAV